MKRTLSFSIALLALFYLPPSHAQGPQCRTAPAGTSTANCASEAFVTQSSAALLNTVTASSSATLSDTSSFSTGYAAYDIVLENVLPASNAVSCEIEVHSGGSFQTTGYLANEMHFAGGGVASVAETTFIPCSAATDVSNSAVGVSGTFRITNPAATSFPKNVVGTFSHLFSSSSENIGGMGTGFWNANGAINGFQVLFSAGNIASGSVKVYGIP